MTILPDNTQNIPVAKNLPSKIDRAAQLLISADPTITKAEIAKECVKLGACQTRQAVYNRFNNKDYLARELQEVRAHNIERIQREHVPKALIKLKKQLGNKDDRVQLSAINTTLKYGMGEMVNTPAPGVSIDAINIASVNIMADISGSAAEPVSLEGKK